MRFVSILLVGCMMLLPAPAIAQTPTQAPEAPAAGAGLPGFGWVDFGVRATTVSGDEDRFQRYRDFGNGAFLERLRWGRENDAWLLFAEADNAGRRDQRYRGVFEQTGLLRASVEWNQIPLRISSDTRTPYAEEGPGILRLSDAIQQGIQAGQLTLASVVPIAGIFETGYRRHVGSVNVAVTARPDLDFRGQVTTAQRRGWMPWGAPFGFNLAVEVPAPIDTRTTDARFELEWTRQGSLLRLNYDGSWFQNEIERLIWDNPIRFTDTTSPTAYVAGNGTSTGRMSLWPSNQMHTVGATGSFPLPHRSRLSGTFAIGGATQNAQVVPFTINSAIAAPELPRSRADAGTRVVIGNLLFTSRPRRNVLFTGRYRLHDLDYTTPFFPVEQIVRVDQSIAPFTHGGPEYFSTRRQNLDLETAYSPLTFTRLRVGYGHTRTGRDHRIFEHTTEHLVRASVDTTGHALFGLRAQVERSRREGHDFNPQLLVEANEQPGMRHYDVADRSRTRFTGTATLTPLGFVGFNASVAVGSDDYDESPFGLRDNTHRVYTLGTDLTAPLALFSLSYAREHYDTFQLSRQASPGPEFTDPSRDWGTDAGERVNSILTSVEFPLLIPRTTVRLSYDMSRSATDYIYVLGTPGAERTLPEGSPVTTLPPVQQLPQVSNEIHMGRLDTRYFFTPRLAAGLVYVFERYRVEDYALGDETIRRIDLPGGLLLYYRYRPYTAHSGWVRLTYLF